jgi:hypothetical protein
MRTLFLLAWTSRMTLVLMFVHWGYIGAMVLIEAPIEWSVNYTCIGVLLVAIGSASVLTVFGRDPRVLERMRSGPERIMRYPYLVLSAAAASNIGGMVLLVHGQTAAAWWAMGLSTAVMTCEISALVGSMFLRAHDSADEGDQS